MEKNSNDEVVDEAVLVRQYKKLLSELDHHEEELKDPANQHVRGLMQEAQQLFPRIKSPKPLYLDAKVTQRMSAVVREQGHGMTSNIVSFNLEEYTAKILQKLSVEPETKMRSRSFIKFGKCVHTNFSRSPALTFLYGAVPSQPVEKEKEKPARRGRARMSITALRETCTLDINQNENNPGTRDGTEELVTKAFQCLVYQFKRNGRKPIDYFHFILDPGSFSKTIENMFHVSFLVNHQASFHILFSIPNLYFKVKEGKAAVSLGKETGGLPVIAPVKQVREMEEEDVVESNQVVINMTMKDWNVYGKEIHVLPKFY